VVLPSWEVRGPEAARFAETFYAWIKARHTLGEAAWRARRALGDAVERLAYGVHAAPEARLQDPDRALWSPLPVAS